MALSEAHIGDSRKQMKFQAVPAIAFAAVLLAAWGAAVSAEAPAVALAEKGRPLAAIFVIVPPAPDEAKPPAPAGQKAAAQAAPGAPSKPARKPAPAKAAAKSPPPPLRAAGEDLQQFLGRIVGGEFAIEFVEKFPARPGPGIYVGRAGDFGWGDPPGDLEAEEFLLRTTRDSQVLLIGGDDAGASHAVYAFLEGLGCRWFFPGKVWEVVPAATSLSVSLADRQKPDFSGQRKLWYGHGMHSPAIAADYAVWARRNRMGCPLGVWTSHSWPFEAAREAQAHPEWYALVKGKRITDKPVDGKPCYCNPEVIEKGVERAMKYFEQNPHARMISVSAPDGLGFCECPLCIEQARAVETWPDKLGFLWGRQADGKTVSVPSETIFNYANKVARAVAEKFPGKYVGILAYSAYSHPPSFPLEPNVYVEFTSGFRNTPLTYAEQIEAFGRVAQRLGVYEYYDVEQWSWDLPGAARASDLGYIAASIGYYRRNHITSMQTEASNNWAPNGIGYYLTARLLWKADADAAAVEEDFYRRAFGPAAEPVKRFYRMWASGLEPDDTALAMAYRALKDAADRTAGDPACRARVDCLRMYAHFLKHYVKPPATPEQAPKDADALAKKWGRQEALRRVQYLGDFTRRLMDTHMVHAWPFNGYLGGFDRAWPELKKDGWQTPGPIPTADEVQSLFAADIGTLDLAGVKDVPLPAFSRNLVPLRSVRPAAAATDAPAVRAGRFLKGTLYVPAGKGRPIEMAFAADKAEVEYSVWFVPQTAFERRWEDFAAKKVAAGKTEQGVLRVSADEPSGYYRICWDNGTPKSVNQPSAMIGQAKQFTCTSAVLYFYVPKGAERFIIKARARGGPVLKVCDGKGNEVLSLKRGAAPGPDALAQCVVDVPPGSDDAVWSVSGPDDAIGWGGITLVGVPNWLSFQPDQVLVPGEAAAE